MPPLDELGQRVKAKYPGQYDDLSDGELGRRVKAKFPDAYGDFTDTSAPPQDVYQAVREGRVMDFVKERGRLVVESPEFRQNVLTTARQGAGQAAALGGALLASPMAAATGLPLLAAEPLAALGGEAAGQIIAGDRSLVDLVVAAGAPVALRGVLRAGRETLRQIGTRLPGAAAGLHDAAVTQARALIDRLRPADLDSLKVAAQSLDDVQVPLQHFRQVAKELLHQERQVVPALRSGQVSRLVTQLDDLISATETQALPLRQVRDNLEEIGARIGELRRQQGTGLTKSTRAYQALRQVYKGLLDDLDALPGDAPQALQEYRRALRTTFAATDLEQIIERAITTRQGDALTSINGRQIKKAWEQAKGSQFLRESFSAADQQAIGAFIDGVLRLPALPTPAGVAAGSVLALTRGGGAGGIVTGLTGDPTAGALAGGIALVAPRVIARAMMTDPGRRLLGSLLHEQPFLSPGAIQLLAAASRQAASPAGRPASVNVPPGLLGESAPPGGPPPAPPQ